MNNRIAHPILWVGPAGCGKLTAARKALGVPVGITPRLQTMEFKDDEYTARYWEMPTHMELDVMDLSMMDKQILPKILTRLLSTRDVTGGRRKIMILRRVHALSPAAAIRLRACMEELVWCAGAPAMIWCTTRVVNSVVMGFMDGFVYQRIAGDEERPDRIALCQKLGVQPGMVPTVNTYIAEMLRQMVVALQEAPPCLGAAMWIRGRVYDLLGLMITGGELVSGFAWATVRMAATGSLPGPIAGRILEVLARSRWVPSYRTPIMLEMIASEVYDVIAMGYRV